MKKSILFSLIFVLASFRVFSQISENPKPKGDYWGTFCLVKETISDTNYFVIDLKELPSLFERIYFKNYFLEQDVFGSRIVTYKTEDEYAIIAVPLKYKVEDFRHFVANIKKITHAFNFNFNNEQKQQYINNHIEK